jgi:hypothetical protein
MEDFDGNNFIINGKTYTFKTEGVSVPALQDKDDGKVTAVNRFHLANVMYREAMKEALQNKGASLTKNDLIISSVGSKAMDNDFYEATMK